MDNCLAGLTTADRRPPIPRETPVQPYRGWGTTLKEIASGLRSGTSLPTANGESRTDALWDRLADSRSRAGGA